MVCITSSLLKGRNSESNLLGYSYLLSCGELGLLLKGSVTADRSLICHSAQSFHRVSSYSGLCFR